MENTTVATMTKEEIAINKKVTSYVTKFNKAFESCEKSAWKLAQVVYETVKSEDFKDVFGTITNYSKALNYSKSSISKMVYAYERRLLLIEDSEDNAKFQRSQIEEMATIPMTETITFIEEEEVTTEDTVKEVREKVSHYMNKLNGVEESVESEESEESEEVEETENDIMIIKYMGEEYQIVSEELLNKILDLLAEG